ncbi:MAG: VOC family protein [Acidobacteriota bacterium]|nr:VOC family protein [Acidobacteriota bacterium]
MFKLSRLRRLFTAFACTVLSVWSVSLHGLQGNLDLAGIAHTAIRVSDLEQSRSFYERLGFQEAFSRKRDGVPTESFFKVNDHQFIELYPRTSPTQPIGFMHVCFESNALQALHDSYVANGLTPIQVLRAGAGNLLFTMQGPEKQNIEYTQYMPGSMHTNDRGKHLSEDRIAQQVVAVGIPMRDARAARMFYLQKMAFLPAKAPAASLRTDHEWLALPGSSGETIAFVQNLPANTFELDFGVEKPKQAQRALEAKGLHPHRMGNVVVVLDPDGNRIEFLKYPTK